MKESRLNYKVFKKHDKYKGSDSEDKFLHYHNKNKTSQKNKEIRDIDRAIRTKDYKSLMEDE